MPSLSSLKFVFLVHPLEVELSVMDKEQLSLFNLSAKISIHVVAHFADILSTCRRQPTMSAKFGRQGDVAKPT
jgi:hypothetical protein